MSHNTATNNNRNINGSSNGETSRSVAEQGVPLYARFPSLSCWEFAVTASNNNNETAASTTEVVAGTVYCTDTLSQTVMIITNMKDASVSGSAEIRVLNASCIETATRLEDLPETVSALSLPATIPKKSIEDREKKAIRQAEEALLTINHKASAKGQEVFDRLLKACAKVSWKEESILVLNQIQVDPPYGADNCRILAQQNLNSAQEALDRVRKIVSADR